jgi:sterol desaturase/sphingolipid hydroxylase (fatty acid hydroxylase superfamily)
MAQPTLISVAVTAAILFVVFRALEYRRPRARRAPWFRPGMATDLSYWFFTPLIAHRAAGLIALLAVAVFALLVYGRIDKAQILAGFGPLSRQPYPVQAILMLIIADFIGYWTHRAFHTGRLWPVHAIHHSSTTLDWLAAARVHPLGDIAGRIAIMIPLLALGFATVAVAAVTPLIGAFALLLHADLDWDWGPLRSVIASPVFHRWHHTSEAEGRDKNFAGLFPVWDILFGTYYMPKGRLPEQFGTDTPVPDGLFPQLMFPFRRRV